MCGWFLDSVYHSSAESAFSPLQIMREIQEHKIKIYEFPETDDEEENKLVKKIKVRTPK